MLVATLLLSVLILLSVWLLIKRRSKWEYIGKVNQAISQASPDYVSREAQKTLKGAQKKAQALVTEAEIEGIKIAAEAKMGSELFTREYDEKLNQALIAAQQKFSEDLNKHSAEYLSFLENLKKQAGVSEKQTEEFIKQRINQVLFNLEQNMSTFLTSTEQKSAEAINLELKSARELIDSYRSQQLSLIDENIIAVLERTLALVMKTKITLKDQMDLVFEALEKAKVEKFFG